MKEFAPNAERLYEYRKKESMNAINWLISILVSLALLIWIAMQMLPRLGGG